jgi:superfamily II DNA helicase RecQ
MRTAVVGRNDRFWFCLSFRGLPLIVFLGFLLKVCVFTLRYDRVSAQFDDTALRQLIARGIEVIEVREHFFECEGDPAWAILITYRDAVDTAPMAMLRGDGLPRADIKEDLSADELARFEAIRGWRNARASRDGKPPYILLTNRQLAAVTKCNPNSLTALGEVQGIGDGKLQDFGREVLDILAATRQPTTATCVGAATNGAQEVHAGD